jgi:hypothetical protein
MTSNHKTRHIAAWHLQQRSDIIQLAYKLVQAAFTNCRLQRQELHKRLSMRTGLNSDASSHSAGERPSAYDDMNTTSPAGGGCVMLHFEPRASSGYRQHFRQK